MEEGFGLVAELAADALFECGWQCVHVGLVFLPKMVDLDGISKYFSFECVFFVGGINASDLVTKYIFITFV